MNIRDLARAVFDGRNISIGADVAGHVKSIVADGEIEPFEVIHAAHDVIEDGLAEYGAKDTVLVQADAAAAAAVASAIVETFADKLKHRLEAGLTAGELNDTIRDLAVDVVGAVERLKAEGVK